MTAHHLTAYVADKVHEIPEASTRAGENIMERNAYEYDSPPAGPVACVFCFTPTTNHRAVWNFEWSGLWHSMCRNEHACQERAS